MFFGLLQSDPAETLGYEEIRVPGFVVGDLLGCGAYSVVVEAKAEAGTIESIPGDDGDAEDDQWKVDLPPGFYEHEVPGDGNCVFHSLADQLQRANMSTASGEPYDHEVLKELATNQVD